MSEKTAYPTELTENLREVAYLPMRVLDRLEPYLGEGRRPMDALCESWREDFADGRVVQGEGKVSFQVLGCATDETIVATLKPNLNEGMQRWALTYVGTDDFDVLRDVAVWDNEPLDEAPGEKDEAPAAAPAPVAAAAHVADPAVAPEPARPASAAPTFRSIDDWAFVWWPSLLPELASRALPEKWGPAEGDHDYLENYVRQTFNKLWGEKKVLVSADKDFAALNTGLVTSSYEDIFLCFSPNRRPGAQPWFCEGACTPGERGLGRRLINELPKLPVVATYFDDVRDLIFDTDGVIYPDYRHILIENVSRLPQTFLREHLEDAPEALALLDRVFEGGLTGDDLEERIDAGRREALEGLRAFLGSSPRHYNRLKSRLDDAVDLAHRRVRWNYRTAIPSYYPRYDDITLLLPLYLEEGRPASVALAVSRCEVRNYRGDTILTMRMAYKNARLVCRPENDWLCA